MRSENKQEVWEDERIYFLEFRKYLLEQIMKSKSQLPSPIIAFIPIIALMIIIYFTIHMYGPDALTGASQVALLFSTTICCLVGMTCCRTPWQEIEDAIIQNISNVSTSLVILLIIGSLSATWMLSGIVPTLIYYGVQLIHPGFFLVCACIICAVISVMIGSSWTTIATIGIALIGIGKALGFHEGWVAGAIISGAYFGDKISPLSETTIMASSVSETPLFKHIRYMMLTTGPSMLISLFLFSVLSFVHASGEGSDVSAFTQALSSRFVISPWLLLVPVLTTVMIIKKVPSLITLFISCLMATICLCIFQPEVLREVAGEGEPMLKGIINAWYGATSITTGNAEIDSLIATRGMSGMLVTVWLILCAMCLGGAMHACRMLESITRLLHRFTQRAVGIVSSTVGTGLFLNLTTADQYISIILTASSFKDTYRREGYESRLLSRSTEDAVTVTSVLIPWNSCGMTQATILNVATFTYLPFCFFNLLSPIMSIIVAAVGYKIKKLNPAEGEL